MPFLRVPAKAGTRLKYGDALLDQARRVCAYGLSPEHSGTIERPPMLLGAHESTSGGLHQAFERALADGAETVQIFTKSSRMWRAKEITRSDVALFPAAVKTAGVSARVHASYLINPRGVPCDPPGKSIEAVLCE